MGMLSETGISTDTIINWDSIALAFGAERFGLNTQGTEWALGRAARQDAEIDARANISGALLIQPPCSLVLELLLLGLRKERLKYEIS